MGNWRNRPPRRFFHRQTAPKSPSPPYSHKNECEPSSSSGFCEDGIPLWEKKFCALIGSVPWQKVVGTHKFMCGNDVLNWDDSAGKESFQNAKERFWAEINGLPCDICLPDPDIYIDEINWNPYIDPDLIKDLESVYFAPDEGERDGKFGRIYKKTRNFTSLPSKECNGNSGSINPWECNNNVQGGGAWKDKVESWNQRDNSSNDMQKINNDDNPWESTLTQGYNVVKDTTKDYKHNNNNNNGANKLNNDDNPWERSFNQGNERVEKNTGGNWGDNLWGYSQGINNPNLFRNCDNGGNPLEQSCEVVDFVKDNKGWGFLRNNSWCQSQQKSSKLDNGDNPWKCNSIRHIGSPKNIGLRDSRGNSWDRGWRDSRGDAWCRKQWDNHNNEPKHFEHGRSGGNWGAWNGSGRQREGSRLSSYKSLGYQRDYNNQTGQCWRSKNANKRVQFCS